MSQLAAPPPLEVADGEPPGRGRFRRTRRGSIARDLIEVALLAVALYLIITFALQTVRVDGTSMVPTLQNGDLLFADKVSYHLHAPNRGDIVILIPPDDPSTDFIKRVVGIPGDQLKIVPDYQGRTAVEVKPAGSSTWQLVQEPYLPDQSKDPWTEQTSCCAPNGLATAAPAVLTVPPDEFFVLGDNRNASKDSRSIGLIPRANILGRAWVRIWPLGSFGFLGGGPTLTALGVAPFPFLRRRRRRRAAAAEAQPVPG